MNRVVVVVILVAVVTVVAFVIALVLVMVPGTLAKHCRRVGILKVVINTTSRGRRCRRLALSRCTGSLGRRGRGRWGPPREHSNFVKKQIFVLFLMFGFSLIIRQRWYSSASASSQLSSSSRARHLVGSGGIPHCHGCGVRLQSIDSLARGYIPLDTIKRNLEQAAANSSSSLLLSPRDERLEMEKLKQKPVLTKPEVNRLLKYTKKMAASPPHLQRQILSSSMVPGGSGVTKGPNNDVEVNVAGLVCKRCHSIKYNNDASHARYFPDKDRLMGEIKSISNAIIVHVIDAVDFPGSLIRDIKSSVGEGKPVLVVVNKIDLVPDGSGSDGGVSLLERMREYYTRIIFQLAQLRAGVDEVHMVSAKTGDGVFDLVSSINKQLSGNPDSLQSFSTAKTSPSSSLLLNKQKDIYMLGLANVGKSQLINMFIKMGTGEEERPFLTTSVMPGTTMELLKVPLSTFGPLFEAEEEEVNAEGRGGGGKDMSSTASNSNRSLANTFLIDTPGIQSPTQLTNFLTPEEIKMTIPLKKIKPFTLQKFKPGYSLFIGGLVRIDILSGQVSATSRLVKAVCSATFYGNKAIPMRIIRTTSAEASYEKNLAKNETFMFPPVSNEMRDFKSFPQSRETRLASWPSLSLVKEVEVSHTDSSSVVLTQRTTSIPTTNTATHRLNGPLPNASVPGKGKDEEGLLEESVDLESSFDVTIDGVGWVTISGCFKNLKLAIYSPLGVGCNLRTSLSQK